ncbi:hypothetical protein [Salimicrobium halophilum]|uniref:Uncharacterized protein n=1 Tax=Salimicrobium halophilum TaxID=86666 RepID=A0A1G8UDH2_9BACI|nr:hypothetical protein [Salimicrobium halophilum]SDJ51771.1 hypothetical protein SAMN04490247_2193 [Salimicrobium halophilum]
MSNSNVNYVDIIESLRVWLLKQEGFGKRIIDIVDKEVEENVLQQTNNKNKHHTQISFEFNLSIDEKQTQLDALKLYIQVLKDFLVYLPECWDYTKKNLMDIDNENIKPKILLPPSNIEGDETAAQLRLEFKKADTGDLFPKDLVEIKEIINEIEKQLDNIELKGE